MPVTFCQENSLISVQYFVPTIHVSPSLFAFFDTLYSLKIGIISMFLLHMVFDKFDSITVLALTFEIECYEHVALSAQNIRKFFFA